MLAEVKKNLLKKGSQLRRVLEDEQAQNVTWRQGVTLNSRKMVQGLIKHRVGVHEKDLFNRKKQVQRVRAGFSITLDHSASMNDYGRWAQVAYLLGGIHSLADKLDVASRSGVCRFSGNNAICYEAVEEKMAWKDSHLSQIVGFRPAGGTNLVAYANAAIDMASTLDATHKVAFFLTDGHCSNKPYLESVRMQALSRGIHLVGIGLGDYGNGLPNGMQGDNAIEISEIMVDSLIKIMKGQYNG